MLVDVPGATLEDYERLRRIYGLDEPFYIQYVKWMWQFVQGQPGFSRYFGMPVMDVILPRLGNTLILTVIAISIGKTIAITLGIYAAVRQYSPGDYFTMALASFGSAVPNFWLGLMLVVVFAVILGWFPTGGLVSNEVGEGSWTMIQDRMWHLVLPVVTMAVSETAATARYMRSSLLEVIRQDYIRTAHAKGLSEQAAIIRHALKNSLIPVVTVIAISFPRVLAGSIVIERVFSYPGMGKLLFDSIMVNDFIVAMVIVMLLAFTVVVSNLIADLAYAWLDPRVQYEKAAAG
jgi:peptide/nickel transport system permease protein